MSRLTRFNSVLSSNLPVQKHLHKARAFKESSIQRAMVIAVHYVDSPANPTRNSQNPEVTYDVVLLSGAKEGRIIHGVRKSSTLGGQHNYSEVVLRPSTLPISGPNKTLPNRQNGDIVFVDCVDSDLASPVIIGCGNHPLDATNTGARKADGPRWVQEYNGVNTIINKNGDWILTRKGGAYDESQGYFTPVTSGNEAQIRLEADKLTASAGNGKVTQSLDGAAEKFTVNLQSGMVVTVDGAGDKVTVVTKGGAQLTVDGTGNKIEAKDKSGGALKISDGKVGLGAASAEVVDLISQLCQLLSTDMGNLGFPLVNAAQYATLKTKADSIKGGV